MERVRERKGDRECERGSGREGESGRKLRVGEEGSGERGRKEMGEREEE